MKVDDESWWSHWFENSKFENWIKAFGGDDRPVNCF